MAMADHGAKIGSFEHALKTSITETIQTITREEVDKAVETAGAEIRRRINAEIGTFALRLLDRYDMSMDGRLLRITVDLADLDRLGRG